MLTRYGPYAFSVRLRFPAQADLQECAKQVRFFAAFLSKKGDSQKKTLRFSDIKCAELHVSALFHSTLLEGALVRAGRSVVKKR